MRARDTQLAFRVVRAGPSRGSRLFTALAPLRFPPHSRVTGRELPTWREIFAEDKAQDAIGGAIGVLFVLLVFG